MPGMGEYGVVDSAGGLCSAFTLRLLVLDTLSEICDLPGERC